MTNATAPITALAAAWRLLLVLFVAAHPAVATKPAPPTPAHAAVTWQAHVRRRALARTWKIHYRAWNGADRLAYVVLPAAYGPGHNPSLPLVISPHGRGRPGRLNAKLWGDLPAVGGFAVVNPDGMGLHRPYLSFAYRGQIDDLARMPRIVTGALPWLRIDRRRIYALGSSMGGQETLLLVARHPHLLAGAAALDSVTDLVRRYRQMADLPCDSACLKRESKPYGLVLQEDIAEEIGSTPDGNPRAWAARSPLANAAAIASSGVPLQIWWSRTDRIVRDQAHQSGAFYAALRVLQPRAQVCEYAGRWAHSHEMRSTSLLPIALGEMGLLPIPRNARAFPGTVACSGGTHR